MLDYGLDDADDLQGDGGHHLCDVAAADKSCNLLAVATVLMRGIKGRRLKYRLLKLSIKSGRLK